MIWIPIVTIVLIAAWFLWRLTSVSRGGKQRDERILKLIDPIGNKLDAGKDITTEEIKELAKLPQVRHMLFAALRGMEREELIPAEYNSFEMQAESVLTYWLMHPNELADAPEKMKLVEAIERIVQTKPAKFYVFKYLMPKGHWAEKDGWLLGFAGPYWGDEKPYENMTSAFSRCDDKFGEVAPTEIIDWYLEMLKKKGAEV
jgi:hypothetical protein